MELLGHKALEGSTLPCQETGVTHLSHRWVCKLPPLCHLQERPRVHPPTTGCAGVVSKGPRLFRVTCVPATSQSPKCSFPSAPFLQCCLFLSERQEFLTDSRHALSLLVLAHIVKPSFPSPFLCQQCSRHWTSRRNSGRSLLTVFSRSYSDLNLQSWIL